MDELPLYRRESSRRKAKEQSQAKREAQAELLMDENDPTLNNPALDLEDSDVDDEWTPLKEKEAGGGGGGGSGVGGGGMGGRRKRGDDSSDEEYDELAAELARKRKRPFPDLEKVRGELKICCSCYVFQSVGIKSYVPNIFSLFEHWNCRNKFRILVVAFEASRHHRT